LARYLARLENRKQYTPKDASSVAKQIRELLGSKEAIGHLRISTRAIEFDLFAENTQALNKSKAALEKDVAKIVTLKPLDKAPIPGDKLQILKEGISLFNEERFWECHEVLEQIWHPAKGEERDIIQGLILTAAAFVHAQRNRNDRSVAMLKKAKQKLGTRTSYQGIDLNTVRKNIEAITESASPIPFLVKL
jgi:uncharacterized protein